MIANAIGCRLLAFLREAQFISDGLETSCQDMNFFRRDCLSVKLHPNGTSAQKSRMTPRSLAALILEIRMIVKLSNAHNFSDRRPQQTRAAASPLDRKTFRKRNLQIHYIVAAPSIPPHPLEHQASAFERMSRQLER